VKVSVTARESGTARQLGRSGEGGRRRMSSRLLVLALGLAGGATPIVAQSQGQEALAIDMSTALRLADERNLDVALYLERVAEASVEVTRARTLAVPTLRVGASYDRHSGGLQETGGQVMDVDRVSQFRGFGVGAVGAGDLQRAGVSLELNVADAIFERLTARQNRAAARAASEANRHAVLLDVATAYINLLEAQMEASITADSLERAEDLASLTQDYAESGEGLRADAELAAVQPLIWRQKRRAAQEALELATTALVRLLHLDPDVRLEPTEAAVPVIDIYGADDDLNGLIARALAARPETEQYEALVAAAQTKLTAERYDLFVPRVSLDYSAGEFGGAPGTSIDNFSHRDDVSLMLYWQFDQFGFANRSRMEQKRSQLRQMHYERDRLRDMIIAEVRGAYARVMSFDEQRQLAAEATDRAERAYDLNRERIYENEGLPLEALQAMQALADVQLMQLEATAGYSRAQIALHTALGNPVNEGP
jgi:outer membrane protein TolC